MPACSECAFIVRDQHNPEQGACDCRLLIKYRAELTAKGISKADYVRQLEKAEAICDRLRLGKGQIQPYSFPRVERNCKRFKHG